MANVLFITYCFSPSLLSFLAIVIAVSVILFENPFQMFSGVLNKHSEQSYLEKMNEGFTKFKEIPIIEGILCYNVEIIILVFLKVFIDLTWLLPTWLIVFFAVELFAFWWVL